jgi:uncharacterized protein with FMN-binding domain
MRRIALWFTATVFAVVLLFTYRTSTAGPSTTMLNAANPPGIVSGAQPTAGATPGSGTTPGQSAPKTADTVVNGPVARTRWGPVQVQVHINNGKIVDVVVLEQPSGNGTDIEINAYALPQLHDQVLQAQSANIDGVSGATVTSNGYIESLQAALDLVHFGQ